MNTSTSVVAVGTSTICQGTGKGSCPPLHLVIGLGLDLDMGCGAHGAINLPDPSGYSWEKTWRVLTWADTHRR